MGDTNCVYDHKLDSRHLLHRSYYVVSMCMTKLLRLVKRARALGELVTLLWVIAFYRGSISVPVDYSRKRHTAREYVFKFIPPIVVRREKKADFFLHIFLRLVEQLYHFSGG